MDCGQRTTEYIKHGPGIKCELRAVLVRLSQSPSLLISGSRSLAHLSQTCLNSKTDCIRNSHKSYNNYNEMTNDLQVAQFRPKSPRIP